VNGKKIDIILVTGFLGAGKTTLLTRLISSFKDEHIGLLINDFGKTPVDGSLIKDSFKTMDEGTIYEIGNGSIFCACLTSSFIYGLKYFMEKSPDVLFIETSGMSDPSSMARLLTEHGLLSAYRIRHVLCVADCTNMLKLRKNLAFIDRQIGSANTVLLNKTDLVSDAQKAELRETVHGVNADAEIHFTEYCAFDFSALQYREFVQGGTAESCNTPGNAPKRFLIPQHDFTLADMSTFLRELAPLVLRLKGYYRIEGAEYYLGNNGLEIEISKREAGTKYENGITLIYESDRHDKIMALWNAFKPKARMSFTALSG